MDPLHLDADALRALASEPIVRRGITYFKEDRVMDLGWDRGRLWATVEGNRKDWPYQVEVDTDEDGQLGVSCDCPFEWEPACKHAVAALMAYAARQPAAEIEVEDAADEAVAERAKRGRVEVVVEHRRGDPWYGSWWARSIRPSGRRRDGYSVQIRSLTERINLCDCADFTGNLLGTCKHVEAVLHHLRKRDPAGFEERSRTAPPHAQVTLAWEATPAPSVRARWGQAGPIESLEVLFDDDGRLRGELPGAIHHLERLVRHRDDIVIGDDVLAYARRLGEEAARARQQEWIRARIHATAGPQPRVSARLYPYQVEGVAFLASNGRALLADDMGLGKTLQAIAAATWLAEEQGVERSLVVCPASLKHQWAREITRFTGQEVVVIQGGPPVRRTQYRRGAPFTIVNYELVLRDVEVIQRELAPDLLVLDEAQRIKNWRTKTATAIKSLDTRYAFVLTGTPLENRLEDLYSVLQVVDPRVLGPLWRFMIDFHVTDERGKVLGYRNLAALRQRLAPVVLRRDRSLVADQLPDRTELRLDTAMDQDQLDLHDAAMSAAGTLAQIAKKRKLTPSEENRLLAALQQARMACNAAGLVDKETRGSPKLTELRRLLEELCVDGGHKVVVFSEWERMTAMAEEVARSLGLGVERLHGGVPTKRRGGLIERFHEDPSCQVFLSTDAGGVGLNLQCATALINLDLPWNPARLDQRIARIHRLGQRQSVQVVLMVAAEGYETQVAGLIGSKRELFRNTLHEDASEDVVGVSKRMLELALAAFEDEGDEPRPAGPGVDLDDDAEQAEGAAAESDRPAKGEDASLDHVVDQLQQALGLRIERILASGRGLLVVVDEVDELAEAAAEAASDEVQVATVDARTYASLRRLGLAGEEQAVFERQTAPPPVLFDVARRKLDAAATLLDGDHTGEAVSLAAASMLATVAFKAGVERPPQGAQAAVWVFGELVPRGVVTAQTAGGIARALALAEAPNVTVALAREVVGDASALLGSA